MPPAGQEEVRSGCAGRASRRPAALPTCMACQTRAPALLAAGERQPVAAAAAAAAAAATAAAAAARESAVILRSATFNAPLLLQPLAGEDPSVAYARERKREANLKHRARKKVRVCRLPLGVCCVLRRRRREPSRRRARLPGCPHAPLALLRGPARAALPADPVAAAEWPSLPTNARLGTAPSPPQAAADQTAWAMHLMRSELQAAHAARAELALEHAALSSMSAYQEDAVQALQLAGLAAAADGGPTTDAGSGGAELLRYKEQLWARQGRGLPGGAAEDAGPPQHPAVAALRMEQGGSGGSGTSSGASSSCSAPSGADASQGPSCSSRAQPPPQPAASAPSSSAGQSAAAAAAAAGAPVGADLAAAGAADVADAASAGAPSAAGPPVPPLREEEPTPAAAALTAAGSGRGSSRSWLVETLMEEVGAEAGGAARRAIGPASGARARLAWARKMACARLLGRCLACASQMAAAGPLLHRCSSTAQAGAGA